SGTCAVCGSEALAMRERPCLGVGSAGADGHQVALGLDDVARAGDDQRPVAVGDTEERLEAAQEPVAAPVLGELDGGAAEIAVLLELALEALEQGEGVGGSTGESGADPG